MSFFGKFKPGFGPTPTANAAQQKKDPNAPVPTPLEKHLANLTGPVREDGSDNYANSIIQCLYYSEPFREHVISFPSQAFLDGLNSEPPPDDQTATAPPAPPNATPYPNLASPARKQQLPVSPGVGGMRAEENKDSPEYKKKTALAVGPVLEMTQDGSRRYQMDESLFTSLRDIFEAIIKNESRIGVVSPHRFLEILRRENEMFRSAMHQDAHEFLNLLLNQVVDNVELFTKQHPILSQTDRGRSTDGLATAEPGVGPNGGVTNGLVTHWVHDLFEGLLTSETRCLTCETVSQRDEAFLDLSVDLAPHTSVTSCLRKFSEEEMLCERNKFHCDNCSGLQEAEKRMKIKRLPRILALHLKRFKYTEDLQRLQKLFHKVVYPFHLRLFNTADDAEDPDRLYELYAVVVHIGGGPYHGHYVSIIKAQDRGWLLFDDELVEPVDKSFVLSFFGGEPVPGTQDARQLACAYVLFYQETTLEAMVKEHEAEGLRYATPPPTTDPEPVRDPEASPSKPSNGLFPTHSVTTPVADEMDHMDHLAHATSAPSASHPPPPPLTSPPTALPTINPVLPAKTKKELKAEQKSEEKERKAREKAELKALELRRREQSDKRVAAWRKQDDELKRVLEESRLTAPAPAPDDKPPRPLGAAGEDPLPAVNSAVKEGGLARFRHGSMSLRGKPRLFSKDRDKEKHADPPGGGGGGGGAGTTSLARSLTTKAPSSTTMVGRNATDSALVDGPPLSSRANGAGIQPPPPPPENEREKEREEKKPATTGLMSRNRFSLGRKKSQNLL
nr:putative ubiquitin carboxyl-terminal hydrolase creb [Quercus suber]